MKRTGATTEERRKLVAVMDERATMLNDLTKTGSASRASYLERAQLLYEQRAELAQEEGRLPEIEAAIEALNRRMEQRR
ncbi:MAG: hypothetical protein SGJ17_04295 [Hyphomicrobiales bacterium]|nr:hypothetical protein [Hyphomicrobiales bacterium]